MTIPWGALATAAANARSGYLGGQFEGQQLGIQRAMAMAQLQRQQQNDAIQNAYRMMMGSAAGARASHLQHLDMAAATDPVTRTEPVTDGSLWIFRKSGAREHIGADGQTIEKVESAGQPKVQPPMPAVATPPTPAPAPAPRANPDDHPGNIDLRQEPTPTPIPNAPAKQGTPTPIPKAPAGQAALTAVPNAPSAVAAIPPRFGRPQKAPVPTTSDKIHDRIAQLQQGGMPLAKASEQARQEFGQQNQTQSPFAAPVILPSATPGEPPKIVYAQKQPGTPTTVSVPGVQKPTPGENISMLALPNIARVLSAEPTMELQHKIMVPFEEKAKKDPSVYNGIDAFQQAFYRQPDKMDIKQAGESALAQSHLNKTNPDLARYLRAGLRFAFEDMTMQARAGTEQKMEADRWISTIGPYMDAASINDTQEARLTRIQGYKDVIPTIRAKLQQASGGKTPEPIAQPEVTGTGSVASKYGIKPTKP